MTPTVYAMADLLPLYRDESGNIPFQQDGTTGNNVLTSGGFDSDFNAGGRFLLGASLGDYYRLEGSFMGAYQWGDTRSVRNQDVNSLAGTGNLFSPFSNFGTPTAIDRVDYNDFASIDFSSNMSNFELNLRRRVQLLADQNFRRDSLFNQGEPLLFNRRAEASFLIGVRYMTVDETFGYHTESTTIPSDVTVDITTSNTMLGAQVGFLSQFLILPKTWIDFEIKGVLFQNAIDVTSSYNDTGTSFSDSDDHNRTAFLGELALMYNHQVSRALTFRAGYSAIWLTQVALATQNFNDNLFIAEQGPLEAENNGTVVYHGPSLGLVFAF